MTRTRRRDDLDAPTSAIRILRVGWRPAMAWCFVVGWTLTLLVTLFMLLAGMVTMADASGLLIVLVGSGAAPVTMFTHGRSREKIEGVADAEPPRLSGEGELQGAG